ncbi:caspase family protein [Albibacillus kandeliae]|uniref:caspase family protein n=1 Tax=Albibacillus kandeliae TaxID=2174228 RepID=UPI000D69BDE1|nr:caspase family protein [Albibacillus kandeliae]
MKLLLVLLLLLASALPALAERRALVLGNGAYPANALPNPTNDARDVAQRLRQMGFLVDEGIDLSRTEAMQLVQTFAASLGRDDIALFYYAGHASQIGSDNYLMPVDADLSGEDALKSSSIRMQSILSSIGERSNTRIIILDACRTNPFVNASASRAGGVRSGLGKMEGGIGSFIAFSTGPNNVAADGRGRNSPFTAALLRHMATPGADIHAIMRNVRAEVRRDTDDQQIPWENSSLIEELYLSAATQPQVQAPAQVQPPAPQPVFSYMVSGLDPNGDGFLALRDGITGNAQRIAKMGEGTRLNVLGQSGAWMMVETETGLRGWAHSNWIRPAQPAARPVASQSQCDQLWYQRNAYFARRGYCFQSARGRAAFAGIACIPGLAVADVPLTLAERAEVERIRGVEQSLGCP